MKNRRFLSIALYVLLLVLVFSWVLGLMDLTQGAMPYSQVVHQFQIENVRSFVVRDQRITLKLYNPYQGETTVSTDLADSDQFRREMWQTIQDQTQRGVLESYDFRPVEALSPYDFILPIILAGLALLLVWMLLTHRMNANNPLANFGRARTVQGVPNGEKVTFADVAGAQEEKQELQEVVDFLRDPEKFQKMGARIPHGLLLVGPPGTGKTLLARAVAGEADVNFLSISGSDFVEMYVGVGASRVRDLFDQAKAVAPAIIFIDEIDAVGRKRGSGLGGGHDEKEQTLNQLLVEMDGFSKNAGVIVLAATNRPDILDPALLRPGRFDRQIHVGAPDIQGREDILKVHARGKRLDETVDLKRLARSTVGFTGADLSNLLNEAAIMATRRDRSAITMDDLNDAMMKILAGPEKPSRVRNRRDLRETAIHEAGHAVAMQALPTQDPVMQITIVPRGQSLGATWSLPRDDSANMTRNQMFEQIVALLGGRVAEDLFLGDISVGASNDIQRATKLARDMAARYGMCERLGAVAYDSDGEVFIGRDYEKTKSYSEKAAATIDDEVKTLIDRAYQRCREILQENQEKVQAVTEFLLAHETMTGVQFRQCMAGEAITGDANTTLFDSFDAVTGEEQK